MNDSILLRTGALLFFLVFTTYCKSTDDPVPEMIVQREDAMSISQARQFATSSIPTSIRITDPGLEGVFRLDTSDRQTADNMGTVLVTGNGKRYKREYTGPALLTWFGATPTSPDIGPRLQAAVDAVNSILIPAGTYTQLTPVRLRSGLTIKGEANTVITLGDSHVSLQSLSSASDTTSLRNVIIDGLSWNVTTAKNSQYGVISIDGPTVANLTVQNCKSADQTAASTNWFTLNIAAGKSASSVVIKGNVVQAKRTGCEILNHDNGDKYTATSILVEDNTFSDCGRSGISLSGTMDGLTVNRNTLKNCAEYGVEIADAARNVKMTNNTFEGKFDKFIAGTDGDKRSPVVGGMLISGNTTVGRVTGGVQLFNGGQIMFTKNNLSMTGMLEIAHATQGGTFSENTIDGLTNKAIICDNSPNNTFSNNTISNKESLENQATFMAYGSQATNNVLTSNRIIKGRGGKYYEAVLGGSIPASQNVDEAGNPLP
ncbi:right-handed parallel beta-helix repeat-containing protein [Spirosoma knui]